MGPSVQQLLIVLAIIVLIFGAKKIPELAKGLGSGIKNFKKAVKDDENPEEAPIAQVTKTDMGAQVTQNSTLSQNPSVQNTQNVGNMQANNTNNNAPFQPSPHSPNPTPTQPS